MTKALTPIRIGGIELSNRIVRSATFDPFGEPGGAVSQKQIDYYRAFGENNVGAILSGMAYILPDAGTSRTQTALYDDSFLPGHMALTKAVHETPAKVFCQICHTGSSAKRPLAPSPIPDIYTKRMPEVLEKNEMPRIVQAFADTALRAKRAGYDGVQLHAAHGYLLCAFLSPQFNQRTDEYGGSAENRFRLVEEVIRAVREATGPDYPLWIRLNSSVAGDEAGAYLNDVLYQARRCKDLGVDAVEFSGVDFTPLGRTGRYDYYLENAAFIAEKVDIPVILVGGVSNFADMDAAFDCGISLVSIGRPFICEPDLITRLIGGQPEAKCFHCSKCFRLAATYPETGAWCVQHQKG